MTAEHLSGLAFISTENQLVHKWNIKIIIKHSHKKLLTWANKSKDDFTDYFNLFLYTISKPLDKKFHTTAGSNL